MTPTDYLNLTILAETVKDDMQLITYGINRFTAVRPCTPCNIGSPGDLVFCSPVEAG